MTFSIEQAVSLSGRNTLAVPAVAEYFCAPRDKDETGQALEFARDRGLAVHVIGGGSNVVLGKRLAGLCIHPASRGREVVGRSDDAVDIEVQAGESWHELVRWSLEQGGCGLENLALIPGCVGAAPIQNIGAYGVELERFFLGLTALDLASGERREFSRIDCAFAYRDSVFRQALRDRYLIEDVRLRLPLHAAPEISYPTLATWLQDHHLERPTPRQVFDAVVAIRSSRLPDPQQIPNAGSFFKNPVVDRGTLDQLRLEHPDLPHFAAAEQGMYKLAAAWLIEHCGFKQRSGPVRVHARHALVLVNPESRSGEELQAFAAEIVAAVRERFGLVLEQEPRNYV